MLENHENRIKVLTEVMKEEAGRLAGAPEAPLEEWLAMLSVGLYCQKAPERILSACARLGIEVEDLRAPEYEDLEEVQAN